MRTRWSWRAWLELAAVVLVFLVVLACALLASVERPRVIHRKSDADALDGWLD